MCGSQEKNMNRVILVERTVKKEQLNDNFTWISQECEHVIDMSVGEASL